MFKKSILSFSFILTLGTSSAFAEWVRFDIQEQEDKRHIVKAHWVDDKTNEEVLFESVSDLDEYKQYIASLPFTEGYPVLEGAEGRFKAQNIDRQIARNPFHLLRVTVNSENFNGRIGLVQFGRMPTINYPEGPDLLNPTVHHPIITKFMDLGVTKQIDPDKGLNKDNIVPIDDEVSLNEAAVEKVRKGLGIFIPMFDPKVQKNEGIMALSIIPHFFQELKIRGFRLPVESSRPHAVVGLFHPEDPNLAFCQAAGFTLDGNPGYGWFYPGTETLEDNTKRLVSRPRVMVTYPLK